MPDTTPLLRVADLAVTVAETPILRGVTLDIRPGEIHALMGPNGSGKSTLAYTLMGHPNYAVTAGTVEFQGRDLLSLAADERARAGIFLSFQHPVAIPGVTTVNFLRAALRAQEKELPARQFLTTLASEMRELNMDESFRSRYINDGFSGGEKKRAEMLQLAMLKPALAILDEPDSGLDVDALKLVARAVERARQAADNGMAVLLITHYNRILQHLRPDHVHVLSAGRIVASGGSELADRIEAGGYEEILGAAEGATA